MKKQQAIRRIGLVAVLAGGALLCTESVEASTVVIDLTTAGASGDDGQHTVYGLDAIYAQTDIQPTGTGVIDPFLTIQAKKKEQGYNTDATSGNLLDDLRSPSQWVRSVKLGDVEAVTYNGQVYAKFLLDINEQASGGKSLLSLNKLQLFATEDPSLTGYSGDPVVGAPTDGFGSNATQPLYDLDATGDKTVKLDYSLGHGSGSGDMYAYIPYSLIAGKGTYLVLYSSFGEPDQSGAGFEEWSVVLKEGAVPGPGDTPLPSAALSGVVILGALSLGRRSRKCA